MSKSFGVLAGAGLLCGLMGLVSFGADAAERTRVVRPIWGSGRPGNTPVNPKLGGSAEEAVDLGALTTSSAKTSSSQKAGASKRSARGQPAMHGPSLTDPSFKFYFDFMYKYRPNIPTEANHGFDSYHNLILVEVMPSNDLTFATEVSAAPRYYEVDYQVSQKFTLRWGKIWIPFDDMAPHNIFGGRINTSEFFEGTGEKPFLPDIWADLGLGVKYQIIDTVPIASELHFYVVNGFDASDSDPVNASAPYPNFQTPNTGADNNNDKAMGARLHLKFFQRLGLGASIYRGTWTDKDQPGKGINMFGLDSQLRPTNRFDLRAGLMYATIDLTAASTKPSYNKGGAYLEAGYKFGENLNWKFLVQTGVTQNDSRVKDNGDKQITGVRLLRRMGPVEASIFFSKDTQKIAGKNATTYGHFRIVTAF